MSFTTHFLSTPFGDFDIDISIDAKNKEAAAIEELTSNLNAADLREAYFDKDGNVYAVDVGFYYGSHYVELEDTNKTDDEDIATVIAVNQLISDLENHF